MNLPMLQQLDLLPATRALALWMQRSLRRAAQQHLARRRQRREAAAMRATLRALDARTLHDLGLHESEIDSVVAEISGHAEPTRRHTQLAPGDSNVSTQPTPTFHEIAPREWAVAAGFKTVAVAVILGIFIGLAEQAPYASQASEGMPPAKTADVGARVPASTPPAGLRAHAGEVPAHIEAF